MSDRVRWLVTTRDDDPRFGGHPCFETVEIDEHPVEYLNGLSLHVSLVFALRLHPEDPVLGER